MLYVVFTSSSVFTGHHHLQKGESMHRDERNCGASPQQCRGCSSGWRHTHEHDGPDLPSPPDSLTVLTTEDWHRSLLSLGFDANTYATDPHLHTLSATSPTPFRIADHHDVIRVTKGSFFAAPVRVLSVQVNACHYNTAPSRRANARAHLREKQRMRHHRSLYHYPFRVFVRGRSLGSPWKTN